MGRLNWVTTACCIFLMWAAAAVALPAQTYTTLHNFDGTDGANPAAVLLQATNGNLYGTTEFGGTDGCYDERGCGTIFQITPSGDLTRIYTFCSQGSNDCTDGFAPKAGLIQGTDGSLYGTTYGNAAEGSCTYAGDCGTVFKITPSGELTTLYSFCSQSGCTDGSFPEAGLVQGTDGNFYGTTTAGGVNDSCNYGEPCGTVFKITPSGALTTLYSFCSQADCADGEDPDAGLVQGTNGNFYGTTDGGGIDHNGTVFQITPGGSFTSLHSFNGEDGASPQAGLVLGADGNFYGTTYDEGSHSSGTAFEITPSGALTTLYDFCSRMAHGICADGDGPTTKLVQGTDGGFYGTTLAGGANICDEFSSCGIIFRISPSGTLTRLHSFDSTDSDAAAGLVQGTNGNFYGTTFIGGGGGCLPQGYGCGTVYGLSVGSGPFVETNPVAAKVGTTVGILGTALTGATGVKFNGTATAFRVVSSTFIEAKVPSGATSGKVQVKLPSGTLVSNVPFIVLP